MLINLQLYVETYQKRSAEDNSYHPEGGSAVTLVRLWTSWFSLFSLPIAFFFCVCTKQKVTKETSVRIHAWIRMGLWYSRTVCLKHADVKEAVWRCTRFVSDINCVTTPFIGLQACRYLRLCSANSTKWAIIVARQAFVGQQPRITAVERASQSYCRKQNILPSQRACLSSLMVTSYPS